MSATSTVRTVSTAGTTRGPSAVAGHATAVLVPVRAGEMRKVSVRCECGWRSVAVSASRAVAVADAESAVAGHLAAARTLAPQGPVAYAGHLAPTGTGPSARLVLGAAVAAVVLLVVALAVGFHSVVG
jgi:hypothetical protein